MCSDLDILWVGAGTRGAIICTTPGWLCSETTSPTRARRWGPPIRMSWTIMMSDARRPWGCAVALIIFFLVYTSIVFGGARAGGAGAVAALIPLCVTNNKRSHRGNDAGLSSLAIVPTISSTSADGASVPSKTRVRHSTAGISSASN